MDSVKIENVSVKDLMEILAALPQNTKVYCCGMDFLWLNHNVEDNFIVIDTENLAERDLY